MSGQPLVGLFVCVTGLTGSDRTTVQDHIVKLGGTFCPHFTRDVTHLVSEGVGSEKYRVAAELGVPIISKDWINECYKYRHEKIDARKLAERYAVKPFSGLHIFITGFCSETREEIEHTTKSLGGLFNSNLSKDCTHLVAEAPSGAKYDFAKKHGIKVVSLDWFRKCAMSGAPAIVFHDDDLLPSELSPVPEPANPKEEFIRSKSTAMPEATKEESSRFVPDDCGDSDTTDDEIFGKPAKVAKLQPTSRQTGTTTTPKKVGNDCMTLPDDHRLRRPPLLETTQNGHLNKVSTQNTLQKMPPLSARRKSVHPRMSQRITSRKTIDPNLLQFEVNGDHYQKSSESSISPQLGIFQGRTFSYKGFNSEEIALLKDQLTYNGGRVMAPLDTESSDFIVVPFIGYAQHDNSDRVVTNCWVEQCLQDLEFHDPDSHFFFRPMCCQLPIPGFEKYVIGISGFEGLRREHVRNMAIALVKDENDTTSAKIVKARQWNIPIVGAEWLFEHVKRNTDTTSELKSSNNTTGCSDDMKGFNVNKSARTTCSDDVQELNVSNISPDTKKLGSPMDVVPSDPKFETYQPKFDTSFFRTSQKQQSTWQGDTSFSGASNGPLQKSFADGLEHANKIFPQNNFDAERGSQPVLPLKGVIISLSDKIACSETGTRVSESSFPHTFNPNKALTVEKMDGPSKMTRIENRNRTQEKDVDMDSKSTSSSPLQKNDDTKVVDNNTRNSETKMGKYVEFIETLVNAAPVKKMNHHPHLNWETSKRAQMLLSPSNKNASKSFTQDASSQISSEMSDDHSLVVYDDPDGRNEKRRLIEQIQGNLERKKMKVVASEGIFNKAEASTPFHPHKQASGPSSRWFLITGVPAGEKSKFIDIIDKLGGKTIDSESWDSRCTHLIAQRPSRTEKCLSACAAGAWILKPSYITMSAQAGKFLNEEECEWTVDENAGQNRMNQEERNVISAAVYWRKKLGNYKHDDHTPRTGSFSDWVVLLVMESSRRESFCRVLKAGGADVVMQSLDKFESALDMKVGLV
ncbi:DNA topoisomerase 2-binding protein 1 [Chytridiales sp. JEL 0842]|nr:DNA topoisomerase 2-binding protein 1 [Chytridiales sp. JEL 0842]